MAANNPVAPELQWELLPHPGGAMTLSFRGELDSASTPATWKALEKSLNEAKVTSLEIDASRLSSCDSAGLSLLYHLSIGGMTPGVSARVTGLGPELEHLFRCRSTQDFQTLQDHETICSFIAEDV